MSHAGLVLLRQFADRTGLTAGLPSPLGGHDRGCVFSDLACAIADGARVISDFRVMGDQQELFGPVASVPTAWRARLSSRRTATRSWRSRTSREGPPQHGYQVTYSIGWALGARERVGAPASTPPTGSTPASRTSSLRTGEDTGLGHFPHDYGLNKAWLDAAMTATILLSWLKFLALDGDLARAEPKTLHAAARLVRGGRRRTLKIAATWPWAEEIVTAWYRVQAIPHPT